MSPPRRFAFKPLAFLAVLGVLTLIAATNATHAQQAADSSSAYERALRYFQDRELENAILELKTVLTDDPNSLAAHVLVARVYLHIGEPAAAEDAITKARRLGADPDITWPLRAEALYAQAKYDELIALTPESGLSVVAQSLVHLFRGRSFMDKSDFQRAELEMTKARDLTPRDPQPHVYLAMLALRAGDIFTAEARAIKGTRVSPDAADVWSIKGDVLHTQGKLGEAVKAYDNALLRNPDHYDARLSRAGVLVDLGRFDDASQDVERLRKRRPLDPRPVYLESVLLAKAKKSTEARAALQRAAALLEEMGTGALDRSMQLVLLAGLANFELGDLEQAQGHLARYVERFPKQPGPRKLLGAVMLRNARSTEAIVVLEPALDAAPNDYKLLALLGSAYMQNGRHDIATRYLERAVKLSDNAPEVRARLALSRVGAGFEDEGLAELSALFDEDPQTYATVGLSLASLELKRGGYVRAAQVAQSMLRDDGKNTTVINLLGAAQMGMGEFDAARLSFEQALAIDDSFLPARVNLGKLEMLRGNLGDARQILAKAIEMRPDSVSAMVELAKVEERTGQAADGLRWLQKAQGTAPNSVPVAIALVDLHLSASDTTEAMRIARDVETRAPENMDVLAALARVHRAAHRDDLALGVYKQMGRLAGFETAKLFRVARLQLQAGAEGDAMYSLEKALKGDANHLPSRLLLTRLQLRSGKLQEASAAAQGLLETHPQLAASHRLAGDVLLTSGNAEAASTRYRRALEIEPGTQHALRVYGAATAAGEQESAQSFLRDWVEAHPDDVVAVRALADNHLGAGRLNEARTLYERIVKRDPLDVTALNNLAFILDRQGKPEAIDYATRAVNAAPGDPLVLDTLGWLLVRKGDVQEGLRRLRDAHSRAASNPEIRYHIAAALVALQRPDEARRELQRALQSPLPFEGIADARKLLNDLGQ